MKRQARLLSTPSNPFQGPPTQHDEQDRKPNVHHAKEHNKRQSPLYRQPDKNKLKSELSNHTSSQNKQRVPSSKTNFNKKNTPGGTTGHQQFSNHPSTSRNASQQAAAHQHKKSHRPQRRHSFDGQDSTRFQTTEKGNTTHIQDAAICARQNKGKLSAFLEATEHNRCGDDALSRAGDRSYISVGTASRSSFGETRNVFAGSHKPGGAVTTGKYHRQDTASHTGKYYRPQDTASHTGKYHNRNEIPSGRAARRHSFGGDKLRTSLETKHEGLHHGDGGSHVAEALDTRSAVSKSVEHPNAEAARKREKAGHTSNNLRTFLDAKRGGAYEGDGASYTSATSGTRSAICSKTKEHPNAEAARRLQKTRQASSRDLKTFLDARGGITHRDDGASYISAASGARSALSGAKAYPNSPTAVRRKKPVEKSSDLEAFLDAKRGGGEGAAFSRHPDASHVSAATGNVSLKTDTRSSATNTKSHPNSKAAAKLKKTREARGAKPNNTRKSDGDNSTTTNQFSGASSTLTSVTQNSKTTNHPNTREKTRRLRADRGTAPDRGPLLSSGGGDDVEDRESSTGDENETRSERESALRPSSEDRKPAQNSKITRNQTFSRGCVQTWLIACIAVAGLIIAICVLATFMNQKRDNSEVSKTDETFIPFNEWPDISESDPDTAESDSDILSEPLPDDIEVKEEKDNMGSHGDGSLTADQTFAPNAALPSIYGQYGDGSDFSKGPKGLMLSDEILNTIQPKAAGRYKYSALVNEATPFAVLEYISGYEALSTSGSPQNKAATWIIEHDPFWVNFDQDSPNNPDPGHISIFVERYILALLYFALGGIDWPQATGWLSRNDVCDWFYVCCRVPEKKEFLSSQGQGNYIITVERPNNLILQLSYNELEGSIPSEIGWLTNLVQLSMEHNTIKGQIPSSLSNLSELRVLALGGNTIMGTIPEDLYKLDQLRALSLNNNHLQGALSSNIGHLTALQILDVSQNGLGKKLPSELGKLSTMQFFSVARNDFWGNIPHTLSNWESLRDFRIHENMFTGTLSGDLIGKWAQLKSFLAFTNELSGALPSNISQLAELEAFEIHNNAFEGGIPTEIGKLKKIVHLFLDDNDFESSIPTEVSQCTLLQFFDAQNNKLRGTIPTEIGLLSQLRGLNLSGNNLDGSIPEAFGNLKDLEDLNLSENSGLGGTISSGVWKLPKLSILDLHVNSLSGEIFNTGMLKFESSESFLLPSLRYLDLEDNPNLKGDFSGDFISSSSSNISSIFIRNTGLETRNLQNLCDVPTLENLKINCQHQMLTPIDCTCCSFECG